MASRRKDIKDGNSVRIVAWNFLSGGSRKRAGHWSRVLRTLCADVVLAQECRPPGDSASERFRPRTEDSLVWQPAGSARWGSAVLVKSARLQPIAVPQFGGWIVGGQLDNVPWSNGRTLRMFSVHGPVGERGYVRTMHAILDALAPLGESADLIVGGDFNVLVGYRKPSERLKASRAELELLGRLERELQLISCWQTANPGRPLAQTLRWTADRKAPYHCDGIFVPASWRERLVSCRVVRGHRWYQLSDHNPVVAELSLGPSAGTHIQGSASR